MYLILQILFLSLSLSLCGYIPIPFVKRYLGCYNDLAPGHFDGRNPSNQDSHLACSFSFSPEGTTWTWQHMWFHLLQSECCQGWTSNLFLFLLLLLFLLLPHSFFCLSPFPKVLSPAPRQQQRQKNNNSSSNSHNKPELTCVLLSDLIDFFSWAGRW